MTAKLCHYNARADFSKMPKDSWTQTAAGGSVGATDHAKTEGRGSISDQIANGLEISI